MFPTVKVFTGGEFPERLKEIAGLIAEAKHKFHRNFLGLKQGKTKPMIKSSYLLSNSYWND